MNWRGTVLMLLALPGMAFAQSATPLPRVAILHLATPEADTQERLALPQSILLRADKVIE